MNDNILEFLKKLKEDEDLQARLKDAKTADEAYEIACSVQDGFTKEEFVECGKKLKAFASEELSEEDLSAVAGGVDVAEGILYGVCGLGGVGGVILVAEMFATW